MFVVGAPAAGVAELARGRRRARRRRRGARRRVRRRRRTRRAARDDIALVVARSRSRVLVAIGLHLALGLPDGALEQPGAARRRDRGLRRRARARGVPLYAAARRADRRARRSRSAVAGAVGLVGYVRRCRDAPHRASARPAPVGRRGAWWSRPRSRSARVVLNVLLSWPQPIAGDRGRLARCSCRSRSRSARRISSRCASTGCSCTPSRSPGSSGWSARRTSLIVLGLGRAPTGSEKTLLGLSMLAAAVAALLWVPARERLAELANRRVYGERHAPDEVLRTFGSRLTRALPLDELLLQLAESLKATMNLEVAEVWTRRRRRASSARCRCPTVGPPSSRSVPRRRRSSRARACPGRRGRRCGCPRCSSASRSRCCAPRRSRTRASCSG